MKTNTRVKSPNLVTQEGGRAYKQSKRVELLRATCACLLWESSFYESGEDIGARLQRLASEASTEDLQDVAIVARNSMHLRHAPLILLAELGRREGSAFGQTAFEVINRVDELTEFVSIFGRKMPSRVKRGLAKCFHKFTEYHFAKYKGSKNKYSLRDVMFLAHPKPRILIDGVWQDQTELFYKIANNQLETPDTWEVELSANGNNAASWNRLLEENKLGALALLRNLRNMVKAGADRDLISEKIRNVNTIQVLPFRFVAAYRAAPEFARSLEFKFQEASLRLKSLKGTTAVLVDVSGSMEAMLSSKSDLSRIDAAAALAACFPGDCDVYSFSDRLQRVKNATGLSGIDSIKGSQPHGGTQLRKATEELRNLGRKYDRLIVITDEQSSDGGAASVASNQYIINVASDKNSICHGKNTVSITGFSENVFQYIQYHEELQGV